MLYAPSRGVSNTISTALFWRRAISAITSGPVAFDSGNSSRAMTVSSGDPHPKGGELAGADGAEAGMVTGPPHLGQRPWRPAISGRTCSAAPQPPHSTRNSDMKRTSLPDSAGARPLLPAL